MDRLHGGCAKLNYIDEERRLCYICASNKEALRGNFACLSKATGYYPPGEFCNLEDYSRGYLCVQPKDLYSQPSILLINIVT